MLIRLGKSSKLGMLIRKPRKRTILVCVCGRYKKCLRSSKTLTQCRKYFSKKSIWANRHHSLTMSIWAAVNENAKRAKIMWTITETCLNPKYLLERQKSYLTPRKLAQAFLHGPMIWKVMQKSAWKDTANWRTQPSNGTKLQLHALTTINLKKNWDLLENCQKFAHTFSKMLVFGTHW